MQHYKKHIYLSAIIIALITGGVATPAYPQQLAANYASTFMDMDEDKPIKENDINPRPLTLADLESLSGIVSKPSSALEDMYSSRTKDDLSLFGYDIFDTAQSTSNTIPAGRVQDDYILSTGDVLQIFVRGQENAKQTYTIDSQGQLVTDMFSTITVSGKTLGDVRKILSDEASRLHNVELSLSLQSIRQIDVLVMGDVANPGRKTLTPFHSVLDALIQSKGVKKTGSLRSIKLVRNGKSEVIDLYAMMMQGASSADKRLRDGDRIIVPPIGPTVAISGAVKRSGVYEIKRGQSLSTLEMLGMAGGVLSPGSNRFINMTLTSDGLETIEDINDPSSKVFGDGGILNVAQAQKKRSRNVELSGHTRDPGQHDLAKSKNLSDLIKNEKIFGDSLYPLIGVIERRDTSTLTKKLIEFSPKQILQRNNDETLQEGDVVHLFSLQQIRALTQNHQTNSMIQKISFGADDSEKPIKDESIISFLQERYAFVRGAVRVPGGYPVSNNTTLEALISVAGGTTIEADENNIEVTSRLIPADEAADAMAANRKNISLADGLSNTITIAAGDTIRVNQKFNRIEDQSITLLGEVKNPGKYDLVAGDTLLTLIQRAGGLSNIAYPDGVIFSRLSERKQEENRYKSQARDLELKLAEMMNKDDKDKKTDIAHIQTAQSLIAQLKDARAVGRITVQADPDILASDPDQNILLEAGDKIFIPRRPLTVRVGGEVLSPASLQFRKGKSADTYIDEAGGTTYYADKDRAFVVYPNGSAKPLSISAWKQGITMITPGSTIIVPRDPKPFNFMESAESITNILANIALTGFYLDDLGDD